MQRPGEGMAREGDGEVAGLRDAVGGVLRGGAWRGRELPGKAGFMQTRGAGLVLGGGVAMWSVSWRRRRTDAVIGVVQGGER